MSSYEFKLITSNDWDTWLAVLKAKATGYLVWDLINPEYTTKPIIANKPTSPRAPQATADVDANTIAMAEYKFELAQHMRELQEWKEQHMSLTRIIDLIHETISPKNLVYLQHVEPDPWHFLRALKLKLAPSDEARSLAIEKEYIRIKAGPSSRQNAEAWLDEWTRFLTKAKNNSLEETNNPKRVYRDFVLAIKSHTPILSQMSQVAMPKFTDFSIALTEVQEQFLHTVRLDEAKESKQSYSAFAVPSTTKANPTLKGKAVEPRECLCGIKHWFSECDYLRPDRPGRPEDFNPDPSIQRRVDKKLKDSKTRDQVNRTLEKTRKYEKNHMSSDSPLHRSRSPIDLGPFSVAEIYRLQSSWILDHGLDRHICNKTMKDRFIKDSDSNDTLVDWNIKVTAYGKIVLNVNTPEGEGVATLTNVAYVPDFPVNAVSGSRLEDKDVHFVLEHLFLHRNGQPLMLVTRVGGHYVLENNTETIENDAKKTIESMKEITLR